MNTKGGLMSATEGLILLFFFMVIFYAWIVIYQPIMSGGVFPILSNTAAFPQGNVAILLLQFLPIIVIIGVFIAFFNQARGRDESPQQGYGY